MENLVGQIINGRYRLDAALGSDALADIYQAFDMHRSTYLELKHLRPELARDPVFLKDVKHKADQLKLLLHPNIVRFHGLEEAAGQVFMLLDLVDGVSLRKAIQSCNGVPFTAVEIMEIMQPVCVALQYAHKMGVVHANLKPACILVEKSGWVQVTDFGITRKPEVSAYLAPEQVGGLEPTPQTDIYALGLILYELLTGGQHPFPVGTPAGTASPGEKNRRDQSHLKAVSPRKYNPQLSEYFERVVLKCLEKEPASRFASMLELLDALQIAQRRANTPYIVDVPGKSTPPPQAGLDVATLPLAPARPKPDWMLIVGGIVGIIALLFIAFIKPSAVEMPQKTPSRPTPISTVTPSILNTPIPAMTRLSGILTASTQQAASVVTAIPPAALSSVSQENINGTGNNNNSGLAAIQGEWIYYRNDADSGKIYRIHLDGSQKEPLNSNNSYNITVSGDWLVYRNDSDAGRLYRLPVEGGTPEKLNDEFSSFINITGDWIYYQNHTGGDMVYRVRMDGTGRERLTDGQSSFISVFEDWIYFVNDSDGHKIYRMHLDGSARQKISDDFSSHINISGGWLYYITRNQVFDARNSSWSTDSTSINRMQLDGSGKEIVFTIKDGSINGYLNIQGDWIYFIPEISYIQDKNGASINVGGRIYRMHLDQSGRETISDSGCNFINIAGDWIYYRKGGLGGKIYRMHLDGSAKESIS